MYLATMVHGVKLMFLKKCCIWKT